MNKYFLAMYNYESTDTADLTTVFAMTNFYKGQQLKIEWDNTNKVSLFSFPKFYIRKTKWGLWAEISSINLENNLVSTSKFKIWSDCYNIQSITFNELCSVVNTKLENIDLTSLSITIDF